MQEQQDYKKERDENIKKMFSQMEMIQEYKKGTFGVFQVEEGSSPDYSKLGRIKVGSLKELRGILL